MCVTGLARRPGKASAPCRTRSPTTTHQAPRVVPRGEPAPHLLVDTHANPLQLAALAVYRAGLLAMVGASALYAWGRGGRRHMLYRHLDHAAIFVMIAGTYTPFIVIPFGAMQGRWLLALIWAVALVGMLLKLIAPRRFEPLSVPLYLVMGWAVLSQPRLLLSLPASVITLLVAGGVFYSVGIVFHLARVRFQEAIWQ